MPFLQRGAPFLFLPTQRSGLWLLLLGQRPFIELSGPPRVTIIHSFQDNVDEHLCAHTLSVIVAYLSQSLCCLQLFIFTVGDNKILKGNFTTQTLEHKTQQSERVQMTSSTAAGGR